jgi:Putative addiction module component
MTTSTDQLISKIQILPIEEKLRLLEIILTDLNKPDCEMDDIWVVEARKRWAGYKAGQLQTVSYEELMNKYKR